MRQRREMVAAIGAVLSLPAMVLTMLHGGSFYELVMLIKEAAEQKRDRLNSLPNRRIGRWRMRDDLQPP